MKTLIQREFGKRQPRAIVLDDHTGSRRMTARRLRQKGFAVEECKSVREFDSKWRPGMVDLIVADWQLAASEHGDKVLAQVRKADWDVPFILVSGKLQDDDRRARVLDSLLRRGSAMFVRRGSNSIAKVCEDAESLTERRDATLLKVILALRDAVDANQSINTSDGIVHASQQLAELVAGPAATHRALNSVSEARGDEALRRKKIV